MILKKQSQQRDLFESERSFRLVVENVVDYALYMLDPTGIITSWNVGGQRIKGYSSAEILGQHFSRFYTETDRANGKPARALRIAREQGRYEEEGWRVRKEAPSSGPASSSTRSGRTAGSSALPRSPATSPSAETPSSGWKRCRSIWRKHRSSMRSAS